MAGNEVFAGQLVSAISPILNTEPKVKKRQTRKRLPPLSLLDICSYHHKAPSSHPQPSLPISHPCQPRPSSPSPTLSTAPQTDSPPSHSQSNYSTPTYSSYTRTIGGKFLSNLLIYLFLFLLFFTRGSRLEGWRVVLT